MAEAKAWLHDELLADLAKHLARPERMQWTDIPMGPSGSVRPDVFTMRRSFTDPRPMSYEIKRSVSDYRSDITKGKWQAYLEFSDGVFFCCPAGMITKEDLPAGCGLMVRSEKGWRTVKAPTLQRAQLDKSIYLKLLMSERDRCRRQVEDELNYMDRFNRNFARQSELGQTVATFMNDLETLEAKAEAARETVKQEKQRLADTRDEVHECWEEIADALQCVPNRLVIKKRIEEMRDGRFDAALVTRVRRGLEGNKQAIDSLLESLKVIEP